MEFNKIYNMDCVEGMRGLPDNSIDLTVTSCPYDDLRIYDNVARKPTCFSRGMNCN